MKHHRKYQWYGKRMQHTKVYITNDTKGYIGDDFSNYVFVEGMPAPVPTGLSWLAQGGEPCDLADIEEWAEN